MHCSIHPLIDNAKECQKCYKSWPQSEKTKYSRVICKRKNWIGRVDHNVTNPENIPIRNLMEHV